MEVWDRRVGDDDHVVVLHLLARHLAVDGDGCAAEAWDHPADFGHGPLSRRAESDDEADSEEREKEGKRLLLPSKALLDAV